MENINNIDINEILNRKDIEKKILSYLENYYYNINKENKKEKINKKSIFIYGNNGIGKTTFIKNLLIDNNFNIIYYDNNSIINKNIINELFNTINTYSILTSFKKSYKKNIIIFDNLQTINFIDKNFLNSIINFLKNLKKNKKHENFNIPIIFINNTISEKKFQELLKLSECIEIRSPSNEELSKLINIYIPTLYKYNNYINNEIKKNILLYLNNKLLKIEDLIYFEKNNLIYNTFYKKFNKIEYNTIENIKNNTYELLTNYYKFDDSNTVLNTDRTTLSLLYHENIIIYFDNRKKILNYYIEILENFKFCDYIDRIIFQKQVWQLNEICYIIKIFYNNFILNKYNLINKTINKTINKNNIIFTKVLTKYSSEYNNYIFLSNICKEYNITLNQLYVYISYIDSNCINYEELNIKKLVYNRIYKLIQNQLNYNISVSNKNCDFDNIDSINNINSNITNISNTYNYIDNIDDIDNITNIDNIDNMDVIDNINSIYDL